MWTSENRCRYDRSKLRYPSDVTDQEWALIEPLVPPAKKGGNKRTVDERAIVNGLMYILSTPVASGRRCRRTCRRAVPSTTISGAGMTTARWRAFIMPCMCNAVSRRGGRPAPLPGSSTARASRAQKKGGLYRSVGV